MSFDIGALFGGNFLIASIISSLDIDLKEKLSPTSPNFKNSFLRFQQIEIHLPVET